MEPYIGNLSKKMKRLIEMTRLFMTKRDKKVNNHNKFCCGNFLTLTIPNFPTKLFMTKRDKKVNNHNKFLLVYIRNR